MDPPDSLILLGSERRDQLSRMGGGVVLQLPAENVQQAPTATTEQFNAFADTRELRVVTLPAGVDRIFHGKTPAGLFHDFHQTWSIQIKVALNAGILPKGISALVERRSGPREADVLAVEGRGKPVRLELGSTGGVATTTAPATRFVSRTEKEFYAARANRVVIKHHLGRTLAVIEIVSRRNKDSRSACREFVEKTVDFLRAGIHVLVIDLLPPTTRDPFGMHKAIWEELEETDFTLPAGKDRTLAAYETGDVRAAYVEAVGVGEALPDMPLFLANGWHVPVPLESTYLAAWNASAEDFRTAVATGVMPDPDA